MFTKEDLEKLDQVGLFRTIYSDTNAAKERYKKLYDLYVEKFGEPGEFYLFSTPGRTEIGGNHTDHNHGCVLAGSVDLDCAAIIVPTDDNTASFYSTGYQRLIKIDLTSLEPREKEREKSESLTRGVAARLKELGYNIGGFRGYFNSNVKRGSGLSSSACIEVLVGKIFSRLYNKDNEVDPVDLAKIGQYAENVYFGKPCGLMDQTACAVGGVISIDFKDTKNPVVEQVQLDLNKLGYCLAVVDTGGNHADLTDDYASVPKEMKSVAKLFGKEVLRDVTMSELLSKTTEIREAVGDRALLRAIHFINDNQRVPEQIKAIKNNDFDKFLALVNESGNSSWEYLQNCMTTKNPSEQGITLALAVTRELCKNIKCACRVHGGGFAGTVQVFIPKSEFAGYKSAMEKIFGENCVTLLDIRSKGTLCIE